jgi:nucleoside-diphosphate-sugar epimerase
MKKRLFLTGVTGNLGYAIRSAAADFDATALVRNPSGLFGQITTVSGDLAQVSRIAPRDFNVILHAAADTRFTAPRAELWRTNVEGVREMIAFARTCPRLERFIYLSTTCVWGDARGRIAEIACTTRPGFHNDYELTKWEAERMLMESQLPVQIVRIPIVIGNEGDGSIFRNGAIHLSLKWIARGLLSVIPAHPNARLDLVSVDFVGRGLAQILSLKDSRRSVIHLSLGDHAPPLTEVLEFLMRWIRKTEEPNPPAIVDLATYRLFKDLIAQTGDALFTQIYQMADVFLSSLVYPKVFNTSLAENVQRPAWRQLCRKVFQYHLKHEYI